VEARRYVAAGPARSAQATVNFGAALVAESASGLAQSAVIVQTQARPGAMLSPLRSIRTPFDLYTFYKDSFQPHELTRALAIPVANFMIR